MDKIDVDAKAREAIVDICEIQKKTCEGCIVNSVCSEPCDKFNQLVFHRWNKENGVVQHSLWFMADKRWIPLINLSLYGHPRVKVKEKHIDAWVKERK